MREIEYLIKKLTPYMKKGYVFGFDTNILMDSPSILKYLEEKNQTVYIARTVYDELDKKKKSHEYEPKSEQEKAARCREALRGIEKLINGKGKILPQVNNHYIRSLGLEASFHANDDKIVASYVKVKEEEEIKIVFITADRGARVVASTVQLEFLDFDVKSYKDSLRSPVSFDSNTAKRRKQKSYSYKKQKRAPKFLKWLFIILIAISFYHFKEATKDKIDEKSYSIDKTVISKKVNFEYRNFEIKNGETTFDIIINNESDEVLEFPRNFWINEKSTDPDENFFKNSNRQNKRYAEQIKVHLKDGRKITAGFMSSEHFEHTNDIITARIKAELKDIDYIETSYKIGEQKAKIIKMEIHKK